MAFNSNSSSIAVAGLALCASAGAYLVYQGLQGALSKLGDLGIGMVSETAHSSATKVFQTRATSNQVAAETPAPVTAMPERYVVRLTATSATAIKSVQGASQALATSQTDGTVGAYYGPHLLLTATKGKSKFTAIVDLNKVPAFASLLGKPGTFELQSFMSDDLLPKKTLMLTDSQVDTEEVTEEEKTQQAVTPGSVFNLVVTQADGTAATAQLPLNDVFPNVANDPTPWNVDIKLSGSSSEGLQISAIEIPAQRSTNNSEDTSEGSFNEASSSTSSLESSLSSLPTILKKKRKKKSEKSVQFQEQVQSHQVPTQYQQMPAQYTPAPQPQQPKTKKVYQFVRIPNPRAQASSSNTDYTNSTSSTSSTSTSNVRFTNMSYIGSGSNVKTLVVEVKKKGDKN